MIYANVMYRYFFIKWFFLKNLFNNNYTRKISAFPNYNTNKILFIVYDILLRFTGTYCKLHS